jgi:hypothetical protein
METSILGDCPTAPPAIQTSTSTKRIPQGQAALHAQPVVGIFVGTGWINILLTYGSFCRRCSDVIAAGARQRFQRVVRFLYYRARITAPETRIFVTCLHSSVAGNVTLLVRSDHGVFFSIVDSAVSSHETAKQRSVPLSLNGPSTVDKLRKLATINGL